MRLLELRLLAFGPFTDEVLDLSHDGLHLVYGPNEAGKSTSLRAITGLLYGIPTRTPDAHLHAYKSLRIGGRIQFGDEVIEVVRRKAMKGSLLDVDEQPIDDARLLRALGGVNRELFLTMFGLDHRTLREGARALLKGEGGVGESLFDAGGARGIGEVLEGLKSEADGLFKARGQTQLLNEALKAFKDTRTEIVLNETPPKKYVEQKRAYEQAQIARDALVAERMAMTAEQKRLGRALRVLPHLAKRRQLHARRSALGDVPRLADDAAERRREAQRAMAEGSRDASRLAEEVLSLAAQQTALEVDDGLFALDEEVLRDIDRMRGRHLPAMRDLPKRERELREQESEARRKLEVLGRDVELGDVDALRLDKASQIRIEELGAQRSGLERDVAAQQLNESRQRLALLDKRLEKLPHGRDAGQLRAATGRAHRAGDLDALVAKLDAKVASLADRAERKRVVVGVERPVAEVAALALPTRAAVIEHVERARANVDAISALDDAARAIEDEAEQLLKHRELLERGGEVPSEAMLVEARAERDEAWKRIKNKPGKVGVTAYERAVVQADDIADRLRRDAERVARRARIDSDDASLKRRRERLEADRGALEHDDGESEKTYLALWPDGVAVLKPPQMLEWLERHRDVSQAVDELAEARAELQAQTQVRARLRQAIVDELGNLGEDAVPGDGSLATALNVAEPLSDELDTAVRRRAEAVEQRDARLVEIARLEPEHSERLAALAHWRADWAEAMQRLGLDDEASVAEAGVVLTSLRDLFDTVREANNLRQRIAGMKRDAEEFASALRPVLEKHLPEVIDEPLDRAAKTLLDRRAEAVKARDERSKLERTLVSKREDLGAAERRRDEASAVLEELARAAGVASGDALEAVEKRVEELAKLERDIAEVEDALFAEGVAIDVLEEMCGDVDMDVARERLDEMVGERQQLEQKLSQVDYDLGGQKKGLNAYETRDGAHVAADQRQACLATVRRLAERYAKVKLAAVILEHEIERYREQNQGPIIRRASKLFPRLTLGEYAKIWVDFDAQALRCVGVDGSDVAVDGLSDGARDQLYLALRLASLERYAEQAELMPFIADDILVHFDEDRARASLQVLSEFSKTTQVLMFTHQARHVELAREVVPAEDLRVHELRGGRRRAKAV